MRIGFGYDVHELVKDRKLIIGGVDILYEKGLLGWSDADVLAHAVIDAILGAMGEGDIGRHFPPGDPNYKGIASLKLLGFVAELLRKKGYAINNIDATIVIQEPRMSPYTRLMQINMAESLQIDDQLINIKSKTEEGLGFTGKGQGVAAYAVCIIHKEI